jgi:hypothetical protein
MEINLAKKSSGAIDYAGDKTKLDVKGGALNVTAGNLTVTGTVVQTIPYAAVTDPGDGNTITPPANRNFKCAVTTAGAETRVLGTPDHIGQIGIIEFATDGGDFTMTNAAGWKGGAASDDVATFADAGDNMTVIAVDTAGVTDWRHIADKGVAFA